MRLIDRQDIDSLTTNAVAREAGISIGTLYQYFADKQAILDALAQRELGALGDRIKSSLAGPAPDALGGRVPAIVRAVLGTYGGRTRVHRLLLERALSRGVATRLNPLLAMVVELFATSGIEMTGRKASPLPRADAFVLTNAFAGVLRGMITAPAPPARAEVEQALIRLVVAFIGAASNA